MEPTTKVAKTTPNHHAFRPRHLVGLARGGDFPSYFPIPISLLLIKPSLASMGFLRF
jgi:hypothetical protein